MIGYVLKMYPRFSETFVLAEILEMERRGRALTIVSLRKPDDGRFHEDLARVGSAVTYLPEHPASAPRRFLRAHLRALARYPARYRRVLRLGLGGREAFAAFLRAPLVAEAADRSGCRRLHAHFASLPAVTAMLAASLAGIPFTFTAHAKDIYVEGRSRALLRRLLREAEHVFTVSDFNRRHLLGIGGTSLESRIVRIYNSVDLGRFRFASRAQAADRPRSILAVGRLVEKKGFGDLVDACAVLRDRGRAFRCRIVGKGPLRETLASRIASSRLEGLVRLVGPRPRGEIARMMAGSSVLAAPCVVGADGNRDGLPTVILEAMASGLPVVSTEVTGIPEAVVAGETGLIVAPGDALALADALDRILLDPALGARLAAHARQRAEDLFDLEKNVARLDALIGGSREAAPDAARGAVTEPRRSRRVAS